MSSYDDYVKPLPCGWCRKVPGYPGDYRRRHLSIPDCQCHESIPNDSQYENLEDYECDTEGWNRVQAFILEKRRKDYEAGFITGGQLSAEAVADFVGLKVGEFEPGPDTPSILLGHFEKHVASAK